MQKNTILIIDDAELYRDILKRIAEELGFKTVLCIDGMAAIQSAAENKDVLAAAFVDIYMPEIDGISVLGHFRKHYADMPVFMVTISEDETDERVSHELGATAFIKKPFSIHLIEQILKDHVLKNSPKVA